MSGRSVALETASKLRAAEGLNAVLHWSQEALDAEGERVDRMPAPGPLAGMAIALKDNIVTIEEPTTCGSRILSGYVSPYTATAVARLRAAGALAAIKTNMDEFAMGSSTENSAYGRVRHPVDPERVPGGSSGGSAALVAAGVVPAALGSETGGSVRQPASFCGIVGLKPSYGRVSRYGLVAFGSSLDCISVFSRTVDDAGRVLAAMSGVDPLDATTLELLSELMDRIGPRLTGSPQMKQANEWTKDQLAGWGLANAHLESWGPFGRGWTWEGCSVRMTAPSFGELVAIPEAWTPGTSGPVRAAAARLDIKDVSELEKLKGQYAGKIVFYGEIRDIGLREKPDARRFDEKITAMRTMTAMPTMPRRY